MAVCIGRCPNCVKRGKCVIDEARDKGHLTPMNQAARDQMDRNGEKYDEALSKRLERFFKP
jgi:hypothetical protein